MVHKHLKGWLILAILLSGILMANPSTIAARSIDGAATVSAGVDPQLVPALNVENQSAQVLNQCANGGSHFADLSRDSDGAVAPPAALYRGHLAAASLRNPPLDPGFEERGITYQANAQSGSLVYPLQIVATGNTLVKFRLPSDIPTGLVATAIRRDSTLFRFGQYFAPLTLFYCNFVQADNAPPEPGPLSSVSAARFSAPVAPDSIVAAFGSNLATQTANAPGVPLPTTLAGTVVRVRDSAGTTRNAALFFVSPAQVNYLMPPETAAGDARVEVTSANGTRSVGTVRVENVAPGLFTKNSDGKGVPSANALRVRPDGSQVYEEISRFDAATNSFVPSEIDIGSDQVFLVLYGTGIRRAGSVSVTIGGIQAQVTFFGPQPSNVGTDQVNVLLPSSLVGRKTVDVQLVADGKPANVVQISIK